MRWYGQLTIIAVLGAAGGWYALDKGYYTLGYGYTGPDGKVQELVFNPRTFQMEPRKASQPTAQAAGPGRGGPGGPTVVEVDQVKTGRVVEVREAVGTARAYESIMVTAKVSGIVGQIDFTEGQPVKAGDVLLRFDADERRADIEGAVAEIRRATAQRDEVRTRLDRAQELRRSGVGAAASVEDLTAQIRTLDSAIAAAEARRKGAEARLEDLIVRAPFAGRLGTRSVSQGAYVSPGTRITTLDDLTRMRVDFAVPENLLGQLKPGQVVRARSVAFGDRQFDGKVTVIDPRVDPVTRAVKLTAEFANPDEALRPGMFLSIMLEVLAKENAVLVAEEAVVSEGLRHLVFPVKDSKVERRVIRIGQRQGGQVEVVEGLQPGETIVVRGVQRVRPGLTVQARPLGQPPAPPPTAGARPPGPPAQQSAAPPARTQVAPVGAANAAERRS